MNSLIPKPDTFDFRSLGDNLRVGIFSDTHGQIHPHVARLLDGADVLLHAGDICADTVMRQAHELSDHVVAVAGNNDGHLLSPGLFASLPFQVRVRLPGGMIFMEHGHRLSGFPHPSQIRKARPEARMIVFGHSHQLLIDDDQLPWVVNPGAAGYERVGEGASCVLLHVKSSQWILEPCQFSQAWERRSA